MRILRTQSVRARLAQNKDFEALGTLILALEKIAAMDLRQTANQAAGVDLQSLLEELRIVVEPSLREDGVEIHWDDRDPVCRPSGRTGKA